MSWVLQMVSRLPSTTGLSEDTTENVLAVGFPAEPSGTEIVSSLASFGTFYTTTAAGATHAVGYYLGTSVSRTASACQIFGYLTNDLTGGTPFGSPVGTSTFTMAAPASTPSGLPQECSVVCSYHGDLTDVPVTQANPSPPPAIIRPQQRRRGRMYLGPLVQEAGTIQGGLQRPAVDLRTDLGLAFKAMANNITSLTTGDLSIWSRADAATYAVVAGYVDDAWDTQRRRGLSPTLRTSFTV